MEFGNLVCVPTVILLPLAIVRFKSIKAGGLSLQITAILSGVALFCYTLAFLYRCCARNSLYYLTPAWSTLLAVILRKHYMAAYHCDNSCHNWHVSHFWVRTKFSLPRNIGDWLNYFWVCLGNRYCAHTKT